MRFLTWNLAMLERSVAAPPSWQDFHTEDAIRRFVLELDPDVVCWQELPQQVPFVETLDLLPATTRSHSGLLATLVTHELAGTEPEIQAVDGAGLLSTLTDPASGLPITIANVHLEPGRGANGRRLEQLAALVSASPTEALLIIGDHNMRLEDAEPMLAAGFRGSKPPKATWDSRRNRFRDDGAEFTAYFTRWFASPTVEVSDVWVHDVPTEHDGRRFHLSDHYALSLTARPTG